MNISIPFFTYGASGLAYMLLFILLCLNTKQTKFKGWLFALSLGNILWSIQILFGKIGIFGILETARNGVWLYFLLFLLNQRINLSKWENYRWKGLILISLLTPFIFSTEYFIVNLPSLNDIPLILNVCIPAAILFLTENIYRNSNEDERWGIKYLCFAAGLVFVYDFYLFADLLLFRELNADLTVARGLVNTIAAPLIMIAVARSRHWKVSFHVSRKVVFNSFALVGSGAYLMVMAFAGYIIQETGGDWGFVLQIIFFSGSILFLFILFASQEFRSRIRNWISDNFYNNHYDYREEWHRYIGAFANSDEDLRIQDKIIRTTADILNSRGGSLWTYESEDKAFIQSATWNIKSGKSAISIDSALSQILNKEKQAVECANPAINDILPSWLKELEAAWLIIPITNRDTVIGILLLLESRAPRQLQREDTELLATVSLQAGSYLAEERALHALSDAKKMEEFNRRFAFVIHDIKNLVGQLSLMMKNAEKFKDNPDFQKDMLDTVANAIEKMQHLLTQFQQPSNLNNEGTKQATQQPPPSENVHFSVDQVVKDMFEVWKTKHNKVKLEMPAHSVTAFGNAEKLITVINHLFLNAIDACQDTDQILLRLEASDGQCLIAVEDSGPGMEQDFITNHLFSPLASKKEGGFGLGAYQARQLVREMDGRMEVDSIPNQGTSMRIFLQFKDPLAEH